MFARIAHLTICHLLCSHSKQHKVGISHLRDGTKDGGMLAKRLKKMCILRKRLQALLLIKSNYKKMNSRLFNPVIASYSD
jgi:hypothetical protein